MLAALKETRIHYEWHLEYGGGTPDNYAHELVDLSKSKQAKQQDRKDRYKRERDRRSGSPDTKKLKPDSRGKDAEKAPLCNGCGHHHSFPRDGPDAKCYFSTHPDYNHKGQWRDSDIGKAYQKVAASNPRLLHHLKLNAAGTALETRKPKPDGKAPPGKKVR